jgi:hypothetical protein
MECIWIGKQKIILFLKFKKNQKEVAVNALRALTIDSLNFILFSECRKNSQKVTYNRLPYCSLN